VKVDGSYYEITEVPTLDKKLKHDIDVVVDRLVIKDDLGNRLADSLEVALGLTDGIAVAEMADTKSEGEDPERLIFSARFACPVSGFTIDEIEPRLFSFNNPFGACPACDGLGTQFFIDPVAVVPDGGLSLYKGAIAPWSRSTSPYYTQTLEALARHYGFKMSSTWNDLPEDARNVILYGSGEEVITFQYDDGLRNYKTRKAFEGVIPNLERRYRETDSSWAREEIEKYQSITDCETCGGYRLKPEALAVKLGGLHIGQVVQQSIRAAEQWFNDLEKQLTDKQKQIAVRILKEIRERLKFLNDVGLEYLTLSRNSGTLSGGESQRIRLASQIGSGLTGVLYVLDEPSIGLHQRDNTRLLDTLVRLRDLGNTVVVVEHDEEAIMAADHVVDIGPGAGLHGGEIIAQGAPAKIISAKKSLTGQYLAGTKQVPVPKKRRTTKADKCITVKNARGNNLKNVDAEIPLGTFTCVTGVSGGGKSTLLIDTLYKSLARKLNNARATPAEHDTIEGLHLLDKVIDIDQSPIGRT
ncbi:MAG: excinuclease ABC subunit A, partial [Pseudomonadota bacterium]|nr:excinuclease ABC subunit A [Pseudomonadota bacterium]